MKTTNQGQTEGNRLPDSGSVAVPVGEGLPEALACPFCGSEARWYSKTFKEVGCSNTLNCHMGTKYFRLRDWNRRSTPPVVAAAPSVEVEETLDAAEFPALSFNANPESARALKILAAEVRRLRSEMEDRDAAWEIEVANRLRAATRPTPSLPALTIYAPDGSFCAINGVYYDRRPTTSAGGDSPAPQSGQAPQAAEAPVAVCPCTCLKPCSHTCPCANPFQSGACSKCDGSGMVYARDET